MEIFQIHESMLERNTQDLNSIHALGRYLVFLRPDELKQWNTVNMLHPNTIKECENWQQHARMDVYDEYNFGVLNVLQLKNNIIFSHELNFYLTAQALIVVTKEDMHILKDFKVEFCSENLQEQNLFLSPSRILFILIDRIIAKNELIIREMEYWIEKLEEKILAEAKKDYSKEIIHIRKQVWRLKNYLEPVLYIGQSLKENENGLIDEKLEKHSKILYSRINRMFDNVLHLRDYITQVREAYEAERDIKLNDIMKVFTVITGIFMPLGLVVGWYGMNFQSMPELKWRYGYVYVIFLSIGLAVALYSYFKKHGWM